MTALLMLVAVTFCLLPTFVRTGTYALSGLLIADLLLSVAAMSIPIWMIFTGVGSNRLNYILTSFIPLAVTIGIGGLSILLLIGSVQLSPIYSYLSEAYQGFDNQGLERLVAGLLFTSTHLKLFCPILAQFSAAILGWSLWAANVMVIFELFRQLYRYDGAVTLSSRWTRSMGWMLLAVLMMAVFVFLC